VPGYTPGAACHSCQVAAVTEYDIPTATYYAKPVTTTRALFTGAAAPRNFGVGAGLVGGMAMALAAL
jgi:hypothetical protein